MLRYLHVNTQNSPKGKPIVLFYYDPHCPYCRAQMEEMAESILNTKEIQFYIFTTWPFNDMRDFCSRYKLKEFPNVMAGVDYKDFFVDHFNVKGVPYTAIYNREGKLSKAFLGKTDVQRIKEIAEYK